MTGPVQFGRRSSGILLHPTSLPGLGIGDLGRAAHEFVDWLRAAGQSYWQMLPLVPTDGGGSPYNGLSAMAGNPLLISLERLADLGLLSRSETSVGEAAHLSGPRVDYPAVARWKAAVLDKAFEHFRSDAAREDVQALTEFQGRHAAWLADYALYRALRERFFESGWVEWPRSIRDREPVAIEAWRDQLRDRVESHAFQQYIFDRQWRDLASTAADRGIALIGDIPIFVAHDSADVWANRDIFELDSDGLPTVVSGVPPDYFSETGQRWGNPLYRWDVLADRGYDWWIDRFARTFELVDVTRVDHFRGFEAHWEIDVREPTAVNGRWVPGPGAALFGEVERRLGRLPIIAEDLGLITPEVDALRERLGFPGMRVLQFAFDGDPNNPHLPANYSPMTVAYTGTHDNDTLLGWWASAGSAERDQAISLLGGHANRWAFVEQVMGSRAFLSILPLQDVLGLGSDGRMNIPGELGANWGWRLTGPIPEDLADRLRDVTEQTGRSPESFHSRERGGGP